MKIPDSFFRHCKTYPCLKLWLADVILNSSIVDKCGPYALTVSSLWAYLMTAKEKGVPARLQATWRYRDEKIGVQLLVAVAFDAGLKVHKDSFVWETVSTYMSW